MKKTLLYSSLLVLLLNLWQYARAAQQRSQAAIITPTWQTTTMTTPRPARSQTLSQDAAPAPLPTPSVTASAPVSPTDQATAKLTAAGLNPQFAALYLQVQAATGTPWQLLAAVHEAETGQRGDTTITSSAGAQGPMQFMPATFRAYATDGDGDGTTRIADLEDAVMTAGRYLAAGGADKGRYSTALYHYNHSTAYVNQVLTLARRLGL